MLPTLGQELKPAANDLARREPPNIQLEPALQAVGAFLAHLFGVKLTPAPLVSVVFAVVLSSFAVPGIS